MEISFARSGRNKFCERQSDCFNAPQEHFNAALLVTEADTRIPEEDSSTISQGHDLFAFPERAEHNDLFARSIAKKSRKWP
jgi:hypothetical protein